MHGDHDYEAWDPLNAAKKALREKGMDYILNRDSDE